MKKYYAGIGARSSPPEILELMTKIATKLEEQGWTLRSGGAKGADQAFARGVKKEADIYLPWRNFELGFQLCHLHNYFFETEDDIDEEAHDSVNKFHPSPKNLSAGARQMMARNFRLLVGRDEPNSSFVVCWTATGEAIGGTGQALRIAEAYNIPIFNLQRAADLERIEKFLEK